MVKEEKTLASKTVFQGRMLHIKEDLVELPNGKQTTREMVKHPGAVAVVAVNEDNKVILVRQYRYPLGKATLEIPAGKLDPGEPIEACARRELAEETGYVAGELIYLFSYYTTPGFTDEIIHVYFTRVAARTTQHTDEDEFIDLEFHDVRNIWPMMTRQEIMDGKTMLGLLYAQNAGLLNWEDKS